MAHVHSEELSWSAMRAAWDAFGVPDDFDAVVEHRMTASGSVSTDDDQEMSEDENAEYDAVKKARRYAYRLGAYDSVGHAFINGKYIPMGDVNVSWVD